MQETSNYGMGKRQRITAGREHFLIRPWHADPRVAYLSSRPVSSTPSAAALGSALEQMGRLGYASVITTALHHSEVDAFVRNGFVEFDRLTVLAHDLFNLDPPRRTPPESLRLRRARRSDRLDALELDQRAFQPFWRLDQEGLNEALGATARTRFRVAEIDGSVVGYSVTGRAMTQGFLQRLAADPQVAGRGVGSALVIDALRWARKRRAGSMLVNTQSTNQRALDLYQRLGFRVTPTYLMVMTRELL